ncbi:MAG: N-acetyltransferase [Nannocystaceae bacterium]
MPRAATSPTIRRARDGDLADLLEIEVECFAGDRLSRRQLLRHLRSPRARTWVAVDGDDRPLAYLLLLEHAKRPPRIYSLATRARARGQGLGARLVDAAIEACRAAGHARLRLEVREDAAAARALYRRRGFVEIGPLPGYYEDGGDGLAMELRVGGD